jgi:hypothetical protein
MVFPLMPVRALTRHGRSRPLYATETKHMPYPSDVYVNQWPHAFSQT